MGGEGEGERRVGGVEGELVSKRRKGRGRATLRGGIRSGVTFVDVDRWRRAARGGNAAGGESGGLKIVSRML